MSLGVMWYRFLLPLYLRAMADMEGTLDALVFPALPPLIISNLPIRHIIDSTLSFFASFSLSFSTTFCSFQLQLPSRIPLSSAKTDRGY